MKSRWMPVPPPPAMPRGRRTPRRAPAGRARAQPLTRHFHDYEHSNLVVSVLLVNSLIQDGKSNYLEGALLVALYLVISLSFWVSPS